MNDNKTLKDMMEKMENQRAEALKKIEKAQREIDEADDVIRRLSALVPVEQPQEDPQEPQTIINTERGLELPGSFNVGNGVKDSLSGIKGLSSVGVRSEGDAS
jgi:Na+/phosphate symporter